MTTAPIETYQPPAEDAASEGDAVRYRLYGLLRDLRAEAQSLQRTLSEVSRAGTSPDPQVLGRELEAALGQREQMLLADAQRIDMLFASVRHLLDTNGRLYNWAGDEVTNIENAWQRVDLAALFGAKEALETVRRLESYDRLLDELIYHAALLTVPSRLNEHLNGIRVGGILDFHEAFRDEIPRDADRVRLLRYIHAHASTVQGVVDPRDGLVYRASGNIGRRLLSYSIIVASAAIGVPAVFVLTHMGEWFDLAGWDIPPSRDGELLVAYMFLGLGAAAHLLLSSVKQARDAGNRSLLVLGDALLWVHVRETSIAAGLLALPIAIIALAFAMDDVGWETAFFVGYSFDSFLDLFLDRFANLVSTRTSRLRDTLASQPATS